jgi:hypothetical protein
MKPSALACLLLALPALAGCGHPFNAATPPGFVDLGDRYRHGEYRAANADGAVLRVRRFDNDPRGEIGFWARVIERSLRETHGYALLDKRAVASRDGLTGVEMRFGHDEGRQPYLYRLVLFVTDDRIYLLEAGGARDEMTKQEGQIDWAFHNFSRK